MRSFHYFPNTARVKGRAPQVCPFPRVTSYISLSLSLSLRVCVFIPSRYACSLIFRPVETLLIDFPLSLSLFSSLFFYMSALSR